MNKELINKLTRQVFDILYGQKCEVVLQVLHNLGLIHLHQKTEAGKESARSLLLTRSVDELYISCSARSLLAKNKIYTIGKLIQKTEQEIKDIPGLGKVSLQRIKEFLDCNGLSFKEE